MRLILARAEIQWQIPRALRAESRPAQRPGVERGLASGALIPPLRRLERQLSQRRPLRYPGHSEDCGVEC